jgi:hypothetical protein
MASQGPNSPGTTGSLALTGSNIVWSNTNNAKTSNNVYAEAVLDGLSYSNYLAVTNFGFALPAGATILGVLVEIERYSNAVEGYAQDKSVKLIKGGAIQGTEKASASNWPSSDAYASYGGSADLWGLTLTEADVEASTFGVGIAVKGSNADVSNSAFVDHIRITITYLSITEHKVYVRYVHLVKA